MVEQQDFIGAERMHLSEAARRARLGSIGAECDVCGKELCGEERPGICPGCGADMNRTSRLDGSRGVDDNVALYRPGPFNMTASELMGMRETGMTNPDIAKAIGTTTPAVERLIGKTPPELVRQAQSRGGKKGAKPPSLSKKTAKTGGKKGAGLEVTYQPIDAKGMCCIYAIDPCKKTVGIKAHGSLLEGDLNFEEMREAAREFADVVKLLP